MLYPQTSAFTLRDTGGSSDDPVKRVQVTEDKNQSCSGDLSCQNPKKPNALGAGQQTAEML